MTHANSPLGSSQSFCKIGSANAAVFPEPVDATPMISRPWRAWGRASAWISVGALNFICSRASNNGSIRPSDLNVISVEDVEASSGSGIFCVEAVRWLCRGGEDAELIF